MSVYSKHTVLVNSGNTLQSSDVGLSDSNSREVITLNTQSHQEPSSSSKLPDGQSLSFYSNNTWHVWPGEVTCDCNVVNS